MISAGSVSMRLAVAATKTSGGFSCIQVKKAVKVRDWDEAESLGVQKLLSISSIQSTAGASASMVFSARWKAASGRP